MLEAGCLEWALLLAIVLRDAMAVVRTVNTASLTDTPLEIVARMREGLSFVELWATTEWLVIGLANNVAFIIQSCSYKSDDAFWDSHKHA